MCLPVCCSRLSELGQPASPIGDVARHQRHWGNPLPGAGHRQVCAPGVLRKPSSPPRGTPTPEAHRTTAASVIVPAADEGAMRSAILAHFFDRGRNISLTYMRAFQAPSSCVRTT